MIKTITVKRCSLIILFVSQYTWVWIIFFSPLRMSFDCPGYFSCFHCCSKHSIRFTVLQLSWGNIYHPKENPSVSRHVGLSFLEVSWRCFHGSELPSPRFKKGKQPKQTTQGSTRLLTRTNDLASAVPSALPHWQPYSNKALGADCTGSQLLPILYLKIFSFGCAMWLKSVPWSPAVHLILSCAPATHYSVMTLPSTCTVFPFSVLISPFYFLLHSYIVVR